MKKQLLTCLGLMLLAINAWAQQSTTVTVGTNTLSSHEYGPIYVGNASGGHISQQVALYTASEINATSFAGRVLTSLAWNKTDSSRYAKSDGILKIYVKQTSATKIVSSSFFGDVDVSAELAGATLVYSSSTQNISKGAGWKSFTLNTPFVWDGTSNLKVIIDWSHAGVTTGNGPMTWATTGITTDVAAYYFDAWMPGTIYMAPTRPDIQMTFTAYSNEVGISAVTSPAALIAPGASPVEVTIKNTGDNALTTATIGWQVNGVAQTNFSWTGNLASGATSSPIALGNFTFPIGASTIKAFTQNPNGVTDPIAGNDTATFKLVACNTMSGAYTINKGAATSATNFKSFADAALVLNSCGVNGPVTITVAPNSGPYNETMELKDVSGVSATNTITFEGNGNTLAATLPDANTAAVKIDNVKYVKINNLVINVAISASFSSGYGIQIVHQSHNATITNCTINMPIRNDQDIIGLFSGIRQNGSSENSNNSLYKNNTINGGGYSMRINGKWAVAPSTTPTGAENVSVIGNKFRDFDDQGLYVGYTLGLIVEGNDFSRPTLAKPGNFNGITLSPGCAGTVINKNRFHNTHGGAAIADRSTGLYCITSQDANAPAGSENIIKNNLFYDLNNDGNVSVINAWAGTDGLYIYNNTISIEDQSRTATNTKDVNGFYMGGAGANIKFVNNVVTINTPGAGKKAAIFLGAATAATFKSNNNVFHIAPGQTTAYVGYVNATATTAVTLADWQAINTILPYDMNSVAVDPAYIDLPTGNLKPNATAMDDKGQVLAAVTDDITGAPRNATTPDAGAYEFTYSTDDAGVLAVVTPTSGCGLTNKETITISIKNFSAVTKTSIPVSFSVDGGTAVTETFTGTLALSGTTNYTFTATADLSVPGAHTITVSTALANDIVPANDAITVTVKNGTPLALPAAIDFETATTGLNALRTITNSKSNITEDAGASNGGTSTKGMIMDGVDHAGWSTPIGTIDPWTTNADNFSAAHICVSTAGVAASDSLILTFDMKQLFKTDVANTNFRVTVNGTQVGPTYRPSSTVASTWQKVRVDLTSYKTVANVQVALESSVKEEYAAGNGTANLIDNINVVRVAKSTGLKSDLLASQVHVFPNPSKGTFNIDLPQGKAYKLVITDLTGKVIKQQQANGKTQFNLEGTAKGIYLLKVSSENGSAVRKLIVE